MRDSERGILRHFYVDFSTSWPEQPCFPWSGKDLDERWGDGTWPSALSIKPCSHVTVAFPSPLRFNNRKVYVPFSKTLCGVCRNCNGQWLELKGLGYNHRLKLSLSRSVVEPQTCIHIRAHWNPRVYMQVCELNILQLMLYHLQVVWSTSPRGTDGMYLYGHNTWWSFCPQRCALLTMQIYVP